MHKAHKSYMMKLCIFWILINFNQFLSKLINSKLVIKKKLIKIYQKLNNTKIHWCTLIIF